MGGAYFSDDNTKASFSNRQSPTTANHQNVIRCDGGKNIDVESKMTAFDTNQKGHVFARQDRLDSRQIENIDDVRHFVSLLDFNFNDFKGLAEAIQRSDTVDEVVDIIKFEEFDFNTNMLMASIAFIEDEDMFRNLMKSIDSQNQSEKERVFSAISAAMNEQNDAALNVLLEHAEITQEPEIQLQLIETLTTHQTDSDRYNQIMGQLQSYSYSNDPRVAFSALASITALDSSIPELTQKITSNLSNTSSVEEEARYLSLLSRVSQLDSDTESLITQIANDTSKDIQVRIHALSVLATHNN